LLDHTVAERTTGDTLPHISASD